jgi:hypothetical protein
MAIRRLLKELRAFRRPPGAPFAPPGHFYSPLVDPAEVAAERDRLWPPKPIVAGVDWNDDGHRQILTETFPRYLPLYDYPELLPDGPSLVDFYTRNAQFSWLDARALFVLLHAWRPRRIIEVGSGYSSLLVADVNRRWFDRGMHVTCIEPYPRAFLKNRIDGLSRLIEDKVQHVPVGEFASLEAGDILFIDSSHVAKTGSDVNRIYFDVLPALARGVRIHIHDVFLPHDYPQSWAVDENRSWNEQYLVRALLMYTKGFRVEFGCAYAFHAFPELVIKALAHPKGHGYGGGSLWLTKIA